MRTMQQVADELKKYSDDEGVDALKAKFDKWISTIEELAEIGTPGLTAALATVKELHRMCSFSGAFNEVRYEMLEEAEFDAWVQRGPTVKIGSNESGYTLERGGERVAYMADDKRYYRVISR